MLAFDRPIRAKVAQWATANAIGVAETNVIYGLGCGNDTFDELSGMVRLCTDMEEMSELKHSRYCW